VFKPLRRVALDNGHELIVQYQGERHGWGAYIAGRAFPPWPEPASADTPAAAIAAYLGYPADQVPAWVTELSDDFQQELRDAPRYPCRCCGHKTLLNPDEYEICDVCGWEDEPLLKSEDQESGPNRISLRQARENFAVFGASKRDSVPRVRDPRPGE
jgi:hypothetical protein